MMKPDKPGIIFFGMQTLSIILVIALMSLPSAICVGSSRPSARQLIRLAAKTEAAELNLSNRALTELLPEIGQLTNLTERHLTYNQLSTLPPEIGKLTKLVELDVGNNHLVLLPAEIGRLSSLEWLLFNLRQLYLGGNQLTGVPRASENCPLWKSSGCATIN